jgi:hypothetical protein
VRAGAAVDELSIVDVAPLVLYSLGVPLPDDLDGRLPAEVFELGRIDRRPPRVVPATAPTPVAAGAPFDREEEATVIGRLRALGYVE